MTTQQKVAAVSVDAQLDELKTVTVFGESWSVRDLMPFAGYGAWRDFVPVIREAMAAVNANGATPEVAAAQQYFALKTSQAVTA